MRRRSCWFWAFVVVLVLLFSQFFFLLQFPNSETTNPSTTWLQSAWRNVSSTIAGPKKFTIAYLIQASGETIDNVYILLPAIYHPENWYAVHVDAKVPLHRRKRLKKWIEDQWSNVIMMDSSVITYEGVTITANTLDAMWHLFEADPNWKYFINISGADYPLLPPEDMMEMLEQVSKERPGANFLQTFIIPTWARDLRIRTAAFDPGLVGVGGDLHIMKTCTNPNGLVQNFPVYKSQAWMVLTRDFIKYATTSGWARRLIVFMANSRCSDENYFPTLIMNSPFKETVINDHMRTIIWMWNNTFSGMHPYLLDDVKFLPSIMEQGSLFARKFHTDSPLIPLIDRVLLGKQEVEVDPGLITQPPAEARAEFKKNVWERIHACFAKSPTERVCNPEPQSEKAQRRHFEQTTKKQKAREREQQLLQDLKNRASEQLDRAKNKKK